MEFVEETAVQLVTAAVAFVLGVLLARIRVAQAYFRARKFWRPVLRGDLVLVLGDGFPDLHGFEASDVVGRGDLVASYNLTTEFARIGFRRLQPVFADRVIGDDPYGLNLRRNLAVLGGPDANTLTNVCLGRLHHSYELEWPDTDPAAAPDDPVSRRDWTPPSLVLTHFGRQPGDRPGRPATPPPDRLAPLASNGEICTDYGVIIRTRNPFLPTAAGVPTARRGKQVIIIYGCYGYGTMAAVQFSLIKPFLEMIPNARDDVECVVACDVVAKTPQAPRSVYFRAYPHGTLVKARDAD